MEKDSKFLEDIREVPESEKGKDPLQGAPTCAPERGVLWGKLMTLGKVFI